jgi:ubiquinol-cytochrome c reductase cytochrome b subunit
MPNFDVVIGHYTLIPNPFWGGVLYPLALLGLLASFPWIERKLTGDYTVHNLADRPRDAPNRTAFGVALLTFVFLVFAFGAADRIFVLTGLSYDTQLYIFRFAIFIAPPVVFFIVRRLCRELKAADRVSERHEEAEEEARRRYATASARVEQPS